MRSVLAIRHDFAVKKPLIVDLGCHKFCETPTYFATGFFFLLREMSKTCENFHPSQPGIAVEPVIQFTLFTGGGL